VGATITARCASSFTAANFQVLFINGPLFALLQILLSYCHAVSLWST
jgi:hypothetical protein